MQSSTFCQSCGMPLDGPAAHGTERDGSTSADYCQYCYQNGTFTNEVKDLTMDGMIDLCAPHMVGNGPCKTEEEARAMMQTFFPTLKRWGGPGQ